MTAHASTSKIGVSAQIFLSYVREDAKNVCDLHKRLQEAGHRPWMDIYDLLPGELWEPAIKRAIKDSDFVLVCLSKQSITRDGFAQRELNDVLEIWREKVENSVYLIPVRLDECKVPERLRPFQRVDFFKPDGVSQLLRSIERAVESKDRSTPVEEEKGAFHEIWRALIGDRRLVVIHAEPVSRRNRDGLWQVDMDREGIALLNHTFGDMWVGRHPLREMRAGNPSAEDLLSSSDILLSGSAVSNLITRNYFNHFDGLRYVIDYTMPDYCNIRIYDRQVGSNIFASYRGGEFQRRRLIRDVGILTIMRNPLNAEKVLIGCMGIHGFGSLACFQILSSPELLGELMGMINLPFPRRGYQILVEHDATGDEPLLRRESLYEIP